MAATKGRIKAISVSEKKGMKKNNVPEARLQIDHGIVGDAHAGKWNRQVSLLEIESIKIMIEKGANVSPGDFAENITTEGIDLSKLILGDKLKLGDEAEIQITKFGKECHERCEIYQQVGDCIMPKRGVFATVSREGLIKVGDNIEVISNGD